MSNRRALQLVALAAAGFVVWQYVGRKRPPAPVSLPALPPATGPALTVRYEGTVAVPYDALEGVIKEAVKRYLS